MSRSMHLACLSCQEHLWIGQTDAFYSGEPHTMEALRQFLVKHRTYSAKKYAPPEDYHELVYTPEPYNGGIEEQLGQDWKEWDSNDFKAEGRGIWKI